MSVDAHELERVALQRKDREQLQAIAVAMGRKPPARARKDQIIEMIMELAGGPPPATTQAPGESTAVAPSTAAGPAPRAAAGRTEDNHVQSRPADAATAAAQPASADGPATDAEGRLPFAATVSQPVVAAPAGAANAPTPGVPTAEPSPQGPSSDGSGAGGATAGAAVAAGGRVASFSPWNDRVPRPANAARADGGAQRRAVPSERLPRSPETGAPEEVGGEEARSEQAGQGRETGGPSTVGADRDADRGDDGYGPGGDGDNDGDGSGDREGGSRRRRRRGRDKERGDRVGVPAAGGGERGDLQDRQERPERPERPERADRNDRQERPERPERPERAEREEGNGQPNLAEAVTVVGHLDLRDEGYGFLRLRGYLPSKEDVYVPAKFVRQFGLRKGDQLTGMSRPAGRGEKNPALLRVDAVNGDEPEKARARRRFEDLTPLFPDSKLRLESAGDPFNMTARIIDLISPIGKGQRGLIVSPPKAGKTTVLKTIAQSIEANNPEVHLIVLLVDERPEEVTDMRRSVKGEVVASTFDRPADEHTHVAEMTLERAKRLVESGADVVIVLDGITRLARAYNLAAPATGRIMSGGIDTGALYPPKKFFGAARNVEEGGSLTILATALVETGSRMDEVIFEEFKGTGNMELRLDRRMAEKRIYPAIDVDASSTRHEELLFERRQLQMVWKLRRVLSGLSEAPGGGLELLIDRMKSFKSNDEFLAEIAKGPSA